MATEDAVLVFPEEVWGVILEMLEDSHDILNVFKAYPELEDALRKKKGFWLIDQVMPHVYPWLERHASVSCRQVCKRWHRAVDKFLEKSSSNKGKYFSGVTLRNPAMFKEFLQVMNNTSSTGRNPFVGRYVTIRPNQGIEKLHLDNFWNKGALELFRQFGKEIWFIEITQITHFGNTDASQFSQCVLQSLYHLPNLKEVHLLSPENYFCPDTRRGNKSAKAAEPNPESRKKSFPPLPHLDTLKLEFSGLPPSLVNSLVSCYSTKIRKLLLDFNFWRREYTDCFPNLRDFTIICSNVSKPAVTNLMMTINAPQLSTLLLRSGSIFADAEFIIEDDVFPWLERFPNLQNLNLSCFTPPIREREVGAAGQIATFPSLKSLSIRDDPQLLNYSFLLSFPSLEHFHQMSFDFDFTPPLASAERESQPVFTPSSSPLKIREYVHNKQMYDSNVWELLPKLKRVTLTGRGFSTVYTREIFDYLRRMVEPQFDTE